MYLYEVSTDEVDCIDDPSPKKGSTSIDLDIINAYEKDRSIQIAEYYKEPHEEAIGFMKKKGLVLPIASLEKMVERKVKTDEETLERLVYSDILDRLRNEVWVWIGNDGNKVDGTKEFKLAEDYTYMNIDSRQISPPEGAVGMRMLETIPGPWQEVLWDYKLIPLPLEGVIEFTDFLEKCPIQEIWEIGIVEVEKSYYLGYSAKFTEEFKALCRNPLSIYLMDYPWINSLISNNLNVRNIILANPYTPTHKLKEIIPSFDCESYEGSLDDMIMGQAIFGNLSERWDIPREDAEHYYNNFEYLTKAILESPEPEVGTLDQASATWRLLKEVWFKTFLNMNTHCKLLVSIAKNPLVLFEDIEPYIGNPFFLGASENKLNTFIRLFEVLKKRSDVPLNRRLSYERLCNRLHNSTVTNGRIIEEG